MPTERLNRRVTKMNTNVPATLVVVDMQSEFLTPLHLIAAVENKVRYWIEHDWPIVIVEFGDNSQTYDTIMKHLSGYPFYTVVTKEEMDGSYEVLDACRQEGFANDRFVVIGQYFAACLSMTAKGIAKWLPKTTVEIDTEACDLEPGVPVPKLKKLPSNVVVLDSPLSTTGDAQTIVRKSATTNRRR